MTLTNIPKELTNYAYIPYYITETDRENYQLSPFHIERLWHRKTLELSQRHKVMNELREIKRKIDE